MVRLIAVKDCPRTQLALEVRFASEDTQPLSGGRPSQRPALWPSNRPRRSNPHGRRGRRRAGRWVRSKEAERLLSCECSSRLGSTASLPMPLPVGDSLEAQQQFRFGLASGLMWAQRIP